MANATECLFYALAPIGPFNLNRKSMKPFNIEAAKRGEPIQTISGEPRRLLLYDPTLRPDSRVIVAGKNGLPLNHWEDGKYEKLHDSPTLDLCNV